MAQLRQDYEKFEDLNTTILVVGPENAAAFASYWEAHDLPFTGLPDPSHEVLKLFGQEVNLFKLGRMPAQALIDTQGIVRFAHYGASMSDIPATKDILTMLRELPGAAQDSDAVHTDRLANRV